MNTPQVWELLKKHGQLLDLEIAVATGLPIEEVRASLATLSLQGDISKCSVTSYVKGKPIEGFQCWVAGYFPKPAPGRKPAAK